MRNWFCCALDTCAHWHILHTPSVWKYCAVGDVVRILLNKCIFFFSQFALISVSILWKYSCYPSLHVTVLQFSWFAHDWSYCLIVQILFWSSCHDTRHTTTRSQITAIKLRCVVENKIEIVVYIRCWWWWVAWELPARIHNDHRYTLKNGLYINYDNATTRIAGYKLRCAASRHNKLVLLFPSVRIERWLLQHMAVGVYVGCCCVCVCL